MSASTRVNEGFFSVIQSDIDSWITPDYRRNILVPKLPTSSSDQDVEEVGSQHHEVSLVCPVSLSIQRFPVHTHQCTHPQTLDAIDFLISHVTSSKLISISYAKCPLCSKTGVLFKDLLMTKILKDYSTSCKKVSVNWRGQINPVKEDLNDNSIIDLVTPNTPEPRVRRFSFGSPRRDTRASTVDISP